jgi:hypothetical protein
MHERIELDKLRAVRLFLLKVTNVTERENQRILFQKKYFDFHKSMLDQMLLDVSGNQISSKFCRDLPRNWCGSLTTKH